MGGSVPPIFEYLNLVDALSLFKQKGSVSLTPSRCAIVISLLDMTSYLTLPMAPNMADRKSLPGIEEQVDQ